MSTKSVRDQVSDLVKSHLDWDQDLDSDKNIFTEYGADELDEIEILMSLEEEFNIELPDDNYSTLNDFVREVERQLKAQ